ncbi:MAG TPA: magnesium chelatase [Euryarchaeota archaeon]|nr:magnesium chelatase [Euryarchaeota archaeon]
MFPFTAIVGQDIMKKALILNVINPRVGGVLIKGQKGTAKSLAVRGLGEILPFIDTFKGCRYNCDPSKPDASYCSECREKISENEELVDTKKRMPIIDIPLNITEDRLVGSIDIESVLRDGRRSFEPGILAEAHRGLLYVDEINLLDDNIVDVLLDAAAMSVVTVEREGISISYPSEFILVGSMNPEEGELRPQLQDRLALQAIVQGITDVPSRVDIIKRRQEFSTNPKQFREKYRGETEEMRRRIEQARELLPRVKTPPSVQATISRLCIDFNVDGHRADIIIERAAETNAALRLEKEASLEDVIEASQMALPHRMRKKPFEEMEFSVGMLKRLVESYSATGSTA